MKKLHLPIDLTQIDHLQSVLFLYPTDSIYGLGGIATAENVAKIDTIKQRGAGKKYSIVAPSFARVVEHFLVSENYVQERQARYDQYGPLTTLCKRRNPNFLSRISDNEYVGIRIIDHPFQQVVEQIGQPFLSTSANISGEAYDPTNLSSIFKNHVDYFVESDAPMTGKSSTLLNYETKQVVIRS